MHPLFTNTGVESMPKLNLTALTKGEARKYGALCKSVGESLGTSTMIAWLNQRHAMGGDSAPADKGAMLIAEALEPLRENKTVKVPLHGYTIKRARRLQGTEPAQAFTVTRNTAPAK